MQTWMEVVHTIVLIHWHEPEEECLKQTKTQMRGYQAEDVEW